MTAATLPCPSCLQPNPAGQRFCGNCGAALPSRCPSCGAENPHGQRFCGHCGQPLQATAPPAPQPSTPPSVAPGPPLAPPAAAHFPDVSAVPPPVPAEPELRLVTILFADLVGSTALGERFEAEEVHFLVSGAQQALAETVTRFGGFVAKFLGDGLMALFGAPIAREDDAERAVLAALEMHTVLDEANRRRPAAMPALQMRIGVTSGTVVAGAMAGGYDVSGDAANTAARLQSAAPIGGVLVGAETAERTRRRITFGERTQLSLKGKSGMVDAYPALGLREEVAERWELRATAGEFVGRREELALLEHAWQDVRAGLGIMVSVEGEPGLGKSRLVAEAVRRMEATPGMRVVRGRCLSYGQGISLHIIADVLRHLCAVRESDAPERTRGQLSAVVTAALHGEDQATREAAVDALGSVFGLQAAGSLIAAAEAQVRRHVLVHSLRLLLKALPERGPVVLLLEDLHWLDAASADVLGDLLRDLPSGLLVLATHRPGAQAPWSGWDGARRMRLQPLPEEETLRLARGLLGEVALTPDLARQLAERTEGNPYFLEELLSSLQDGGLIVEDGRTTLAPGAVERLPGTLTEVLLARLDRLEAGARAVAQVASVIGREFAVRLLAHVVGRSESLLTQPLGLLEREAIAFPHRHAIELSYFFKHATLQEAAYSTLLVRRRRAWHSAVARALADLYSPDEYTEMIAYHFAHTDEHAEAARWLERAGDRAAASYANATAIEHYRAARERLTTCQAESAAFARLDEKIGDLHLLVGEYIEACEDFSRAQAPATEPDCRAELSRKIGEALVRRGEHDRALAAFAAAEGEGGPGGARLSPAVRASVALSRGSLYWRQGDAGTAEAAAAQVHALLSSEPESRATDLLRARAYHLQGNAAMLRGDFAAAESHYRESVLLRERSGDLQGLANSWNNLGIAAYRRSDLSRAEEYYRECLSIRQRIGDQEGIATSWSNLGEAARVRGNLAQAETYYRRGLALYERMGEQMGQALTVTNLGSVLFYWGDLAGAEDCYRRGLAMHEHIGNQAGMGLARLLLSFVAASRGDLDAAAEHVQRSLKTYDQLGDQYSVVLCWLQIGSIACERGDLAAAVTWARKARRMARQIGLVDALAAGTLVQANARLRAGRLRQAAALLEHGRALAEVHALADPALQAAQLTVDLQLRQGRLAEARAAAEALLRMAGGRQLRQVEALVQRLLGECALAEGSAEESVDHLRAAIRLDATMHAGLEEARAALALARSLVAVAGPGDIPAEAYNLLTQAQAQFTKGGAALDLEETYRLAAAWGLTASADPAGSRSIAHP